MSDTCKAYIYKDNNGIIQFVRLGPGTQPPGGAIETVSKFREDWEACGKPDGTIDAAKKAAYDISRQEAASTREIDIARQSKIREIRERKIEELIATDVSAIGNLTDLDSIKNYK